MHKVKKNAMSSIFLIAIFYVCFTSAFLQESFAVPTPQLTEAEMLAASDIVVEGIVSEVTLKERWVGNNSYDMGYEWGVFECSFLINKSIKGNFMSGQNLQYYVKAYMEGKWDTPQTDYMKFQYVNTTDAVTPGTKMRIYLKWDTTYNSYMRVHFNSGFIVLGKSDEEFPRIVGVPIGISAFVKGDVNGDGKVDSADYTLIRRYILSIITEFSDQKGFIAADVNSDGKVDTADYTLVRRYILGLITKF